MISHPALAASLAALLIVMPPRQAMSQAAGQSSQAPEALSSEPQAGNPARGSPPRPATGSVPKPAAVRPRQMPIKPKPKPVSGRAGLGRSPALAKVAAANAAALVAPLANGSFNAIQVYPFSEGALFQVFCAPERVTDVVLEEGEALISISAGDTARWMVADTASGSGAQKRVHVLIKPLSAGLRTNLIINTDRRSYHLALESTTATAMTAISFRYASRNLLAAPSTSATTPQALENTPSLASLEAFSPASLNFDYVIEGDHPRWRPLRAFDDGRRLYISLPKQGGDVQAPPLYAVLPDGCLELINYQVRGGVYVVDHLVDTVQLRAGERRQEVVRISRRGSQRLAKACRS